LLLGLCGFDVRERSRAGGGEGGLRRGFRRGLGEPRSRLRGEEEGKGEAMEAQG
jgi:hypothetical protein